MVEPQRPAAQASGAPAELDALGDGLCGEERAQRQQTYDGANTPALSSVAGKSAQGEWMLLVEDKAKADVGKIRELKLEMEVE